MQRLLPLLTLGLIIWAVMGSGADPSLILPMWLISLLGLFFLAMANQVARANPQKYEELRRRSKSMKNVVLGLVEPGEFGAGGMAYRHNPDGTTTIVRTGRISDYELQDLYGDD